MCRQTRHTALKFRCWDVWEGNRRLTRVPVETDIKILLRNIGVVVLELRHVAESRAGQAVGLAELPEALLLEKAGLVAPAGQGDEHPFVRRAVVVLVAHDVGQTLVLHQDTDALKDGGDLLRALGLIAGEHVELGGLVGVSPPIFRPRTTCSASLMWSKAKI